MKIILDNIANNTDITDWIEWSITGENRDASLSPIVTCYL